MMTSFIRAIILPHTIVAVIFLAQASSPATAKTAQQPAVPAATQVVVLGVSHSAQLAARTYSPALFRAYFNKVKPDAICIERDPRDYARHSFYEFTYEQQNIAIPWAEQTRTPVFPVDWLPSEDDELLAWNTANIDEPGFLRNPNGFRGFTVFDDPKDLATDLFFADSPNARKDVDTWYDSPRASGRQDFARRLELYRTFMQAMRIRNVAERFPGKTVLVVVGQMHKYDIEALLANEKNLEIVSPTTFGTPNAGEIEKEITVLDLFAIATYNLLGAQSLTNNVDWEWIGEILGQLEKKAPRAETVFLRQRFNALRGLDTPQKAVATYSQLLQQPDTDKAFTYSGVIDRQRVDSYFDPFGSLTVRQRLMLELARESGKIHDSIQMESWKNKLLLSGLTELQKAQLQGYWRHYVEQAP